MSGYRKGDAVMLLPCGPCMDVEEKLSEQRYRCRWFNRDGRYVENDFAVELLASVNDCHCNVKRWIDYLRTASPVVAQHGGTQVEQAPHAQRA